MKVSMRKDHEKCCLAGDGNNIFHDFKVLIKVFKAETFNVDFPSK